MAYQICVISRHQRYDERIGDLKTSIADTFRIVSFEQFLVDGLEYAISKSTFIDLIVQINVQ